MSNGLVALMFSIGAGGWIYYQMMRRTGGNTKASVFAAVAVGAVAFFVMYSMFAWVFPSDETALPGGSGEDLGL